MFKGLLVKDNYFELSKLPELTDVNEFKAHYSNNPITARPIYFNKNYCVLIHNKSVIKKKLNVKSQDNLLIRAFKISRIFKIQYEMSDISQSSKLRP